MQPVFYIAEAVSIDAGDIALALLFLAGLFALFAGLVIGGAIGFARLAAGERESFLAKAAPVVGLVDLGFLALVFTSSIPLAVAPIVVHGISFLVGLLNARSQTTEVAPGPEFGPNDDLPI